MSVTCRTILEFRYEEFNEITRSGKKYGETAVYAGNREALLKVETGLPEALN